MKQLSPMEEATIKSTNFPPLYSLDGLESGDRVVVAMSGGVDSSVCAALVKEMGYDTIGITLQLYHHGEAIDNAKSCCAGLDIYDAKRVAAHLSIPHYVLDYESRFKESVIDAFADSYVRGETPLPCVSCNQTVKFQDLLLFAHELGAKALVTGHYVQRRQGKLRSELHSGYSDNKDQSYFLYATTQEQLDFLRFPLGSWTKEQTRAKAAALGLMNSDKPDSQDICFVPQGSYADLVKKLRPESTHPGVIRHIKTKETIGQHQGTIYFTVGQRKGLKVGGLSEPLYVIKIDPLRHIVWVGPKQALAQTQVFLKDVNWLGDNHLPHDHPFEVEVKLRSSGEKIAGRLRRQEKEKAQTTSAHLELDSPIYGLAPGQAAVFYSETRVLGGGVILSPEQAQYEDH